MTLTKFPSRYPNLNALWSSLILEEFWRLGVRECCIAPGSRSAPLTLAAACHTGFKKHIHFDERGLGFFALGRAKQSERPVIVITTSGTAVANLYPAIIEAKQSGVPLIAITADRPPELIDCGANQAIDQYSIYGSYPEAAIHFPVPDRDISANWVLTSVDQAFAQSCQQGLPLHINCMFREPLYPKEIQEDYSDVLKSAHHWMASDQPLTTYRTSLQNTVIADQDVWRRFIASQGLIVVGRMTSDVDKEVVVELAEVLNWPILADVQSGLQGHPCAVSHADLLMVSQSGKQLLTTIDRVLQFGGHLVSKRLGQFLASGEWSDYIMIANDRRRMDTGNRQTYRFVGSIREICQSLLKLCRLEQADTLLNHQNIRNNLHDIERKLITVVKNHMNINESLSEVWIGANISEWLPDGSRLFLGNSLPIRLVDMFSSKPISRVYTNRGVSGIDGVMATAFGIATVSKEPLVLMLGDLSFLHDLNSLALASKVEIPVVIILLNNDGGGIFDLLPLSHVRKQAETYFQTPHGLNARGATTMFNIRYYAPVNRHEFEDCLISELAQPGCSLIEVKTMPGEAVKHIKQMVCQAKGL